MLEADAVLGLIDLSRTPEFELVASDILRFKIRNGQNAVRREYAADVLLAAEFDVHITDAIRQRAHDLERFGIAPVDALHIASAEAAEADCFCTCDDDVLEKVGSPAVFKVRIVSPLDLILEIER
ncbi:MAG: PIN domain-containing protein [Candidatus Sumerlaeota bacterium]|nr:PIN domain-containing protein [Candidatus Sumerlaeota bacterium]